MILSKTNLSTTDIFEYSQHPRPKRFLSFIHFSFIFISFIYLFIFVLSAFFFQSCYMGRLCFLYCSSFYTFYFLHLWENVCVCVCVRVHAYHFLFLALFMWHCLCHSLIPDMLYLSVHRSFIPIIICISITDHLYLSLDYRFLCICVSLSLSFSQILTYVSLFLFTLCNFLPSFIPSYFLLFISLFNFLLRIKISRLVFLHHSL